jgi:hypothetical protein
MVHSFVDRDMVMRYHWGCAVGHIYCYSTKMQHPEHMSTSASPTMEDGEIDQDSVECEDDTEIRADIELDDGMECAGLEEMDESGCDDDDDCWSDTSSHSDSGREEGVDDLDDQELLEMDDMYGGSHYIEQYE